MPRSRKRFSRRKFGQTTYQKDVNYLTGALGPKTSAFWIRGTNKGPNWSLASQPLYMGPSGLYETSFTGIRKTIGLGYGRRRKFGRKFSRKFGREHSEYKKDLEECVKKNRNKDDIINWNLVKKCMKKYKGRDLDFFMAYILRSF